LLDHEEVALDLDARLRDEDDLDHPALDLTVELPPETAGAGPEPLGRLLEGEDDAPLARERPAVEELEAEDRLPRSRRAADQEARPEGDAFAEEVVEPRDRGLQPRRLGLVRPRLAL